MLLSLSFAAALTFVSGDPAWEHASVSAYVVDIRTGEVLLDEGGDKSLVPASCVKVMTTAAALALLDPEEQMTTDLEYDGRIDEKGTLHGNLYIHGHGDPCLGSSRCSLSWQDQIALWVEAVVQKGIQDIEGEVIGDASFWEEVGTISSWAWEDLGNYYGAGASALSFHENAYNLIFKPGKQVGERAALIRTEPKVEGLSLVNTVTSGPKGSGDRVCIYGSELSLVQVARGTVPIERAEFTVRGSIPNPSVFCAQSLKKALEAKGIVVLGKTCEKGNRVVLHKTFSPPIREIVYWTNQKSVNLYAEHLLKKIGERKYGEGSTEAGLKGVRDFLQKEKIDLKGLQLVDGSGLSRQNLVTAKQFVSLLVACRKSPHYALFKKSLPEIQPGVVAKSGSMRSVVGFVGYAGEIAFAIVVNCALGIDVKEQTERFLAKLLEEKRL